MHHVKSVTRLRAQKVYRTFAWFLINLQYCYSEPCQRFRSTLSWVRGNLYFSAKNLENRFSLQHIQSKILQRRVGTRQISTHQRSRNDKFKAKKKTAKNVLRKLEIQPQKKCSMLTNRSEFNKNKHNRCLEKKKHFKRPNIWQIYLLRWRRVMCHGMGTTTTCIEERDVLEFNKVLAVYFVAN